MPAEPSRPPATPAEAVHAMDRLISAHLFGQHQIAQELGMSVTDLTCFGYVIEAGDDLLTAGELAVRAHVTTGAVTGILNRLERAEYVTRRPDPTDRRRVRVAVVPAAVERVMVIYGDYYVRLHALFGEYSGEEIGVIRDWFTRATALAHDYLENLGREHGGNSALETRGSEG
ncbi:MarR family transcriptional regulator [Streptomyces sp. NPDC088387]|uniref:MarR family transcriptional regulator n=1 Tax=Streptomyces sp. NPDC088387 TaxID=3365859 RepID=UPI00382F3622